MNFITVNDLGSSLGVETKDSKNKLEIQVSKEGDNLIVRKEDGLYLADLGLGSLAQESKDDYLTKSEIQDDYALKANLPEGLSDLDNDSGFLTQSELEADNFISGQELLSGNVLRLTLVNEDTIDINLDSLIPVSVGSGISGSGTANNPVKLDIEQAQFDLGLGSIAQESKEDYLTKEFIEDDYLLEKDFEIETDGMLNKADLSISLSSLFGSPFGNIAEQLSFKFDKNGFGQSNRNLLDVSMGSQTLNFSNVSIAPGQPSLWGAIFQVKNKVYFPVQGSTLRVQEIKDGIIGSFSNTGISQISFNRSQTPFKVGNRVYYGSASSTYKFLEFDSNGDIIGTEQSWNSVPQSTENQFFTLGNYVYGLQPQGVMKAKINEDFSLGTWEGGTGNYLGYSSVSLYMKPQVIITSEKVYVLGKVGIPLYGMTAEVFESAYDSEGNLDGFSINSNIQMPKAFGQSTQLVLKDKFFVFGQRHNDTPTNEILEGSINKNGEIHSLKISASKLQTNMCHTQVLQTSSKLYVFNGYNYAKQSGVSVSDFIGGKDSYD